MSETKNTKQRWKAGNMIYPLPAVMVSCGTKEKPNIITIGWTGTICTNPAMTYISVRPSRFSYDLIKESGYFVINLTTRALIRATDYCGVKSGRDCDKFKEMKLTPVFDNDTGCPMIKESPVSIECRVTEIKELGSHDMFIAEVLNVYVDEQYMDAKGKFHLNQTDLIAYSHGTYFTLGEELGTFGYSVRKKNDKKLGQKESSRDSVKTHNKAEHKEYAKDRHIDKYKSKDRNKEGKQEPYRVKGKKSSKVGKKINKKK